jgi:hypothetical protein
VRVIDQVTIKRNENLRENLIKTRNAVRRLHENCREVMEFVTAKFHTRIYVLTIVKFNHLPIYNK